MIVSQFCESMIRMSRANFAASIAIAGAWMALVGCCGGGPSHKCDFTPPGSQTDAGDAAVACGTEVCQLPQVCCLKKIAPFASCIDPKDYVADDCEKMQMDSPPCLVPTDCDGGTVCCLQVTAQTISCQPPPLCPGDGKDTYLTCASDLDCPSQLSGACTNVGTNTGSDVSISVCAP
jgi:hypothetical protein